MLRNKTGGIAIITAANPGLKHMIGLPVECLEFLGQQPFASRKDYWRVKASRFTAIWSDSALTPIQPQPEEGEDEMLKLLGRPEGEGK